jgi:DNA-binding transcriptional ArsR family regulator
MAIFRSDLQGRLLARVLLGPSGLTVTDLARELGSPIPTVHREVVRLQGAGILTTDRVGRSLLVKANDDNPAMAPLKELVAIAFGPRQIVQEEFAEVSSIEELFIFGSWAARYGGESGRLPGDVDVLVVGAPDRDELYEASDRAGRRLARDVNVTLVTPERWRDGSEPFLQGVRNRPLVPLCPREAAT